MSVIAYLRISTDKQDEDSQRQIVGEWSRSTGRAVDSVASDRASGALPWQERELSFVLNNSTQGDSIIVSEISRIARSTVGVLTFLQAAAEKKVNVVAIKSGITLDGSTASKIVVTVLAMAAEIERDLLRERTKAALGARKARGLPVGRQHGATGKTNKLDGRFQEIKKLLDAKVSKSAIARILGVSRQTLHAFLEKNNSEIVAKEQQSDLPV